jgi:hypothetical protein
MAIGLPTGTLIAVICLAVRLDPVSWNIAVLLRSVISAVAAIVSV